MTVLFSAHMQKGKWLITLLSAALSIQACSVAPPPDPAVPGPETERMVLQRVSAVIVSKDSNLGRWVRRGFPVRQAPGDADGGSATPISPDGYFLTADHVLANMDGRHVYVIYGGGGPLKPHRARVIWRAAKADLALLHIDSPTPLYYRLTPPDRWLPAGTPVIHGGIATGFNSDPGLLGTPLPPESPFTRTRKFKIDIPLQPGDSGGPVVDARGGLIGVNSAVEFLVPMETAFFVDSEATRPSARMLESLIESDRAARTTAVTRVE